MHLTFAAFSRPIIKSRSEGQRMSRHRRIKRNHLSLHGGDESALYHVVSESLSLAAGGLDQGTASRTGDYSVTLYTPYSCLRFID